MSREKHITPGSAAYYNKLARAGVRINPGGKVTQITRGSDGVAREKDLGQAKGATQVLGRNNQFVPALVTEKTTVVVETGPGTAGQLSHEKED